MSVTILKYNCYRLLCFFVIYFVHRNGGEEGMTQKEYEQYRKEEVKNNGGFVNDSFEDEMRRALENEEFVALPDEEETRGNSCMSSSDFEQMCLQELENEIVHFKKIMFSGGEKYKEIREK